MCPLSKPKLGVLIRWWQTGHCDLKAERQLREVAGGMCLDSPSVKWA